MHPLPNAKIIPFPRCAQIDEDKLAQLSKEYGAALREFEIDRSWTSAARVVEARHRFLDERYGGDRRAVATEMGRFIRRFHAAHGI
jgi:hypothetical protein